LGGKAADRPQKISQLLNIFWIAIGLSTEAEYQAYKHNY
jgi:hypothetical protein